MSGTETVTGIALRSGRMDIARVDTDQSGQHISWLRSIEVPGLDFSQAATDAALEKLTRALKESMAADEAVEQRVLLSLPDPLARAATLDFSRIPRGRDDLAEVIQWRLRKEHDVNPATTVCRWQRLGAEGARELVYAVALNRDWLETVDRACESAGLMLSGLDIETRYDFNRLQEYHTDDAGPGVLANITEDYFTLLAWDAKQRPQLLRSRWRASVVREGLASELERLIAEVERMVLAYLYGEQRASADELYVLAPPTELEELVKELRRRLPLSVQEANAALHDIAGSDGAQSPALAVAVGQ